MGLIVAGATQADPLADDRFAHLGVEDGLGGRVLDIAQDSQGFLWFALQSGLRQYDGSRVKSHVHDPDDPHSISDDYIRRLWVDGNSDLWAVTSSGQFNKWLPEDEQFLRLDFTLGGMPLDIEEPSPGRLLVTLEMGETWSVVTGDGTAEVIPSLAGTRCITLDPARRSIWAFGSLGLTHHDPDDLSVRQVTQLPVTFNEEDPLFLDCLLSREGHVWGVAYPSGALRFDPEHNAIQAFHHQSEDPDTLTGDDLAALLEDSQGNLWIAGFSGLNRYRPESQTFRRFTSNPINRRSLVNHQIHTLFEDRTGQLWLGTDAGAARFDPLRENFLFYSHDPTVDVSAPAGSIRSFTEDEQGRLWIGSRSHGIARMDRHGGETLYYSAASTPGNGLPDNTAWALSYESPGLLWIGGEAGLTRLDIATGTWRTFVPSPKFTSDRVVTLFRDRRGSLWVGSDDELYRHDPVTDTLQPLELGRRSRVLALTDDASGRLFVGLEGAGLVVLDAVDGGTLHHWPGDETSPGQLTHNIVTALLTLPGTPETIWAATLGGGLHRLEPDDTWSHFGAEQGLPFHGIRTLQGEPDGTLWMTTERGMVRFDPGTGTLRSFRSADGLPSVVHTKASFQSRAGEFFFGGLDGFVAFFPDSIQQDTTPPRVVLSDFRIGNDAVAPRAQQPDSPLAKSITVAGEVTLAHFQNDFSIELSALHFGDPARNRFAYRLEGVDSDWIETSAERSFARYSRIPSGRHLFRAKAANRDGVWSTDEAQLRVHVLPAPWRSWWAWALYAAAAAGLVVWRIRSKIAYLKLEKELQEQELKVLRGLLPICATCKKIRDDDGDWEPLETYLNAHSDAQLTHGICPQCATKILGTLPSSMRT